MSARELMAELQKFDPETPVVTTGPDGFDLYHCVYRKLKPERSGDEVRPKGRVNL